MRLPLLFLCGCVVGPIEGTIEVPVLESDAGVGVDAPIDAGRRDAGPKADGGVEVVEDAGPALTEQDRKEQAVLRLVNEQRAMGADCGGRSYGPSDPLVMDPALHRAARKHSEDMAAQDYFDHTSLDGRSPWDRMQEEGYRGQAIGENIAAGSQSAQGAFEQWLSSSGHCANMMNPDAREIGIGYAYDASSSFGHYWTQTFGR